MIHLYKRREVIRKKYILTGLKSKRIRIETWAADPMIKTDEVGPRRIKRESIRTKKSQMRLCIKRYHKATVNIQSYERSLAFHLSTIKRQLAL